DGGRQRPDGGGRQSVPRARPRGVARGRRLGHADLDRRQHQCPHHHDRRTRRRVHAGQGSEDRRHGGLMNEFGRALRRWRRLRGVKQSYAAELFGVTQATLSRWELGYHRIPEYAARKLARLLSARLNPARDAGLRRLVESSSLPVHLICDLSHRLLAASPARFAEWRAEPAELRGVSLWRFATDEIISAENRLGDLGWYDDATAELRF